MSALAFGPGEGTLAALSHPYSWIAWLPGYSGLRVPARMYMLAVLCLAVAAGIAFAYLWRQRRWRLPLAAVALAGLVADGAIAGMPLGFPPGDLALDARNARVLVLPYEEA